MPATKELVGYSGLILFCAFVIGLAVLVFKTAKFTDLFGQKESKWLLLTLLIMVPVTFIGRFVIKGSESATSVGTLVAVVCFPLGMIPLFSGIGLIGLLPTLFLAIITGLLQAGMFNQDPFNGIIYTTVMLAFVLAVDRIKNESKEISNTTVLLSSLIAFGVGIVSIAVTQFASMLSVGMLEFQRLAENVFNLSTAMGISIAIGSLAAITIKYYFPEEWIPAGYLKPRAIFNPVNFTLSSIDKVMRGEFALTSKRASLSRDELRLSKAFEKLQNQTQLNSTHQAKLLALDPATFSGKDLENILTTILKASLTKDSQSARIALKDFQAGIKKTSILKRMGEGDLTQAYAYLDEMVIDKLGEQPQLVLSDIKLDQFFGLSANTPYPQSLIALNLHQSGQFAGVLWVGFEKTHWFTREQLSFYEELASRANAAIAVKSNKQQVAVEGERLIAAFEALDDPVLILDADDSVCYLNSKATQLAHEEKRLINSVGDRKVISLPELQTQLSKGSIQTRSALIQLGKGKEFEANIRPFKTDSDKPGKLILLRETTWIKKVSQQKSEFVTNISHDLRAPLNLMRGYVSLLENIGNLSDEQSKYVNRIQGTIENMSGLVRKVMSLEQLDNEEALHYSTFEIKNLIDESINMVNVPAHQRKVTIETDLSGLKVGNISADRVMLQQALFNLVENAVKFSNRGDTVLISGSTDEEMLHLAVQDRGKGIAPLDQPKLFTRFFHVDEDDKFGTGGQGLGLSIVKSVAIRHGGNVSVRSQLGEGSTFYLDLPLRR